jgi:hypothetical protein
MGLCRISEYIEVSLLIGKLMEKKEEGKKRDSIKLSIMHETHRDTHTQMIIRQCDLKDNI